MKKNYWVYILLCENNTYYTGYTTNIKLRYQAHLSGKSKCKYTKSFKPIKIAQCWQIMDSKSLALKIEIYIKKLSRNEKEQLIQAPASLLKIFQNISVTHCE